MCKCAAKCLFKIEVTKVKNKHTHYSIVFFPRLLLMQKKNRKKKQKQYNTHIVNVHTTAVLLSRATS